VLRVDSVDSLRHGDDAEVLNLPRVPVDVRGLFDGVVRDGGGGFLLQLRPDVSPVLNSLRRRTCFVRAVLGAVPANNTFNRVETE
jgi:hypothetical protein